MQNEIASAIRVKNEKTIANQLSQVEILDQMDRKRHRDGFLKKNNLLPPL
jgi:hypothetical protein